MGSDKALLELAGQPLLRHALDMARAVTKNVKIVGDPAKYAAFGIVVPDLYHDHGPLGGIHAALVHSITEFNLILATDLPFVEPEFLRHLITIAGATEALVTVPQIGAYFEPLCAVYPAEACEVARRVLSQGQLSLQGLVRSLSQGNLITRYEIPGPEKNLYLNLNEWGPGRV